MGFGGRFNSGNIQQGGANFTRTHFRLPANAPRVKLNSNNPTILQFSSKYSLEISTRIAELEGVNISKEGLPFERLFYHVKPNDPLWGNHLTISVQGKKGATEIWDDAGFLKFLLKDGEKNAGARLNRIIESIVAPARQLGLRQDVALKLTFTNPFIALLVLTNQTIKNFFKTEEVQVRLNPKETDDKHLTALERFLVNVLMGDYKSEDRNLFNEVEKIREEGIEMTKMPEAPDRQRSAQKVKDKFKNRAAFPAGKNKEPGLEIMRRIFYKLLSLVSGIEDSFGLGIKKVEVLLHYRYPAPDDPYPYDRIRGRK